MARSDNSWYSGTQKMDTPLTKKILIAEIHRIANEKWPVHDKMREAKSLVEQYFKMNGNEEMLNASFP